MATVTEIRQKLIQGGMVPQEAQKAAVILADLPAFTQPSGQLWDTLTAKNFRIISRTVGTVFRILTNDKDNIIVMTKDAVSTIFKETPVASL